MWTHRLLYVLTLAVSAVFYVLYPHWFSWYLLVLLLLLFPFDLLFSLPGMLTRRITLSAPHTAEQGTDGAVVITTLSARPFPSGAVKLRLRIWHEDKVVTRRTLCGGARGSKHELALDTSRSGLYICEIRRVAAASLLGLTAATRRACRGVRADILVLPAPIKPPRAVALPKSVRLRPKPGGGFSEEHDIRPYRRGDPVNSVHWKLSAKHDSLMIREPLVPPPHSRLVNVTRWESPAERDLILSRLRWTSDWLLGRGVAYYIRLAGQGAAAEITRPDELTEFLRAALSGGDVPAITPPSRYSWVFSIDAREVTG